MIPHPEPKARGVTLLDMDRPQSQDWWQASDGKWYPPESKPPPPPPSAPSRHSILGYVMIGVGAPVLFLSWLLIGLAISFGTPGEPINGDLPYVVVVGAAGAVIFLWGLWLALRKLGFRARHSALLVGAVLLVVVLLNLGILSET